MTIHIHHSNSTYKYRLERLETINNRERWKVIGNNGEIILSNNRPVLLRHGLKKRAPDWLPEGKSLWNKAFMELIIEAIEEVQV